MPKFVPVVDVEKPLHEQNIHSEELSKHRQFDNPHDISKSTVHRGWQQGSLGWGVLGSFGSNDKDDGSQVINRSSVPQKMIKNEKGLWVKVKDDSQLKPMGRGKGISVLDELENSNSYEKDYADSEERSDKHDLEDSRSSRKRSEERSHKHKDYRNRSNSRDRYRRRIDRSVSRERYDRRHGRSHSRDNDRSRRKDSRDRYRKRDRSYSRDSRDNNRDRQNNSQEYKKSSSKVTNVEVHPDSANKDNDVTNDYKVDIPKSSSGEESFIPELSAIQIVNRFLEVYSNNKISSTNRLNEIMELFDKTCVIYSLKTSKVLLNNIETIKQSFSNTKPTSCIVSKRVFIESQFEKSITYSLDFHIPGNTPGLGDPAKDTILLYKCIRNKIVNIWGYVDSLKMASNKALTKRNVLESKVWPLVKGIVSNDFQLLDEDNCCHFHDYDDIETWG
eukprot:gene19283-25142_t